MTMKMLALAAMLMQSVARTKLDPPHDAKTHGCMKCWMFDGGW
jgi:hypothetical protein